MFGVSASQMRTMPSCDPETMRAPLGSQSTEKTALSCPQNVCRSSPHSASQMRITPNPASPPPVTMRVPAGFQATESAISSRWSSCSICPVAASQILNVGLPCPPAEAIRVPVGSQATEKFAPTCPESVWSDSPVCASQMRKVWSSENIPPDHESRRPSSSERAPNTGPVCPSRVARDSPVPASQRRKVLSPDHESKRPSESAVTPPPRVTPTPGSSCTPRPSRSPSRARSNA